MFNRSNKTIGKSSRIAGERARATRDREIRRIAVELQARTVGLTTPQAELVAKTLYEQANTITWK